MAAVKWIRDFTFASLLCEFLLYGSAFCFCNVLVFLKEGRWIGFLLMSYTKRLLDFQTYMSWPIVIFYKDSFSIQFPEYTIACLKSESLNYGHYTFLQWDIHHQNLPSLKKMVDKRILPHSLPWKLWKILVFTRVRITGAETRRYLLI